MYIYRIRRMSTKFILISVFVGFVCCSDFLEVDVEKSQITKDKVFEDDIIATSAVMGIYSDMYASPSFANGNYVSVTGLCGMSSNQLHYYSNNAVFDAFGRYDISSENSNVLALWKSLYYTIYSANNAFEGLNSSISISDEVKDQLIGEVLFVRAFSYFYLVNLFGDVPLVLSTDYRMNSVLNRNEAMEVYDQIIDDLVRAKTLLSYDYPTAERTRPNKSVAAALLARVYLYIKDWSKAELNASEVIEDGRYKLLQDLNAVFLKGSEEAIWQLRPSAPSCNTNEGITFLLVYPPNINSSSPFGLTNEVLNAFEQGDFRRKVWVDSLISEGQIFYYPFKYKMNYGELSEYSMVVRLSEMYLIRSEARFFLDEMDSSVADLNLVRQRAGIASIDGQGIAGDSLLMLIEREREVELLAEWGHRWLDLKRTDRADDVLGELPGYSSFDSLYPIPKGEFDKNPFLGDQNDGY